MPGWKSLAVYTPHPHVCGSRCFALARPQHSITLYDILCFRLISTPGKVKDLSERTVERSWRAELKVTFNRRESYGGPLKKCTHQKIPEDVEKLPHSSAPTVTR
ncbi:unnamed protein product [Fusarium venenatum]|uniref:Uncharacterized protein n=1 Tax=Fusarium venenatum TaxID=56646 RepID=A0A2L2TW38_9HYPO|nr:uncharacterized protein FVRRES_01197 [Fusarium venenatum]CEI64685.1 unnamed protein product [Fusarium venenatum]